MDKKTLRWVYVVVVVLVVLSGLLLVTTVMGMRAASRGSTPDVAAVVREAVAAELDARAPEHATLKDASAAPAEQPAPSEREVAEVGLPAEAQKWVIAWHGRAGLGEAEGWNGEFLVAYRWSYFTKAEEVVTTTVNTGTDARGQWSCVCTFTQTAVTTPGATLEWWSADVLWLSDQLPPKDEWGNDSIKMIGVPSSEGWNWFGSAEPWVQGYFPKASWLRPVGSGWEVCEDDDPAGSCDGNVWTLSPTTSPPVAVLAMIPADVWEQLASVPKGVEVVVVAWERTKELNLP